MPPRFLPSLLALVSLLSALAAQAQPAPDADPVIISTGAVSVRKSEFEAAIATLPAEYQRYAEGPGRRQFADDFLRMRLLAVEAEKNGLASDPALVTQLALMRANILAEAQLRRIGEQAEVSEEELRQQYAASVADYEQVTARHILVAFKGSPARNAAKPELTEEEAKAKAEQLRAQLVGGAAFDELAKSESDDVGSGQNGGSLGAFTRGQMVPEFEQAAFTAEVGAVSPVVRTQFGYHILRVDNRSTVPFEQVRPMLEKSARDKVVQEKLQALQAAAQPDFDAGYFGPAAAPKQ